MISSSIALQVIILAFAAGGAWMAVTLAARTAKKLAKEAHEKIDALARDVREGFQTVHARLDDAEGKVKSNVVELSKRL